MHYARNIKVCLADQLLVPSLTAPSLRLFHKDKDVRADLKGHSDDSSRRAGLG